VRRTVVSGANDRLLVQLLRRAGRERAPRVSDPEAEKVDAGPSYNPDIAITTVATVSE